MKTLVCFAIASSMVLANSLPKASLQGTYVEARNADVYTGPCYANSEVNMMGNLAVMGWRIEKGQFNGVDLAGLGVVGVIKASATLGDVINSVYPVESVLIVDQKASGKQREALIAFAKRIGGDLFQHVNRVEVQPISLELKDNNLHSVRASLKAGQLASIVTRPIQDGDHHCSNEEVWYEPLTKVDHYMAGVTIAHDYKGKGLDTTWSSPLKRSAFVASFHLND
jgi:hypothetical protein